MGLVGVELAPNHDRKEVRSAAVPRFSGAERLICVGAPLSTVELYRISSSGYPECRRKKNGESHPLHVSSMTHYADRPLIFFPRFPPALPPYPTPGRQLKRQFPATPPRPKQFWGALSSAYVIPPRPHQRGEQGMSEYGGRSDSGPGAQAEPATAAAAVGNTRGTAEAGLAMTSQAVLHPTAGRRRRRRPMSGPDIV